MHLLAAPSSGAAAAARGRPTPGTAGAGWPAAVGPRARCAALRGVSPRSLCAGAAEPAAGLQFPAYRARNGPPFPPPSSPSMRADRQLPVRTGQWRRGWCRLQPTAMRLPGGAGPRGGAADQWGGGAAGMRWRREHRRPAGGAAAGKSGPPPSPGTGITSPPSPGRRRGALPGPSPRYGSLPGLLRALRTRPQPAAGGRAGTGRRTSASDRPLRCFPRQPGFRRPCCGGAAAPPAGVPRPPGGGVAARRAPSLAPRDGPGGGSGWEAGGTSVLPFPRPRGFSGWGALPAASLCCIAGEIPPAPPARGEIPLRTACPRAGGLRHRGGCPCASVSKDKCLPLGSAPALAQPLAACRDTRRAVTRLAHFCSRKARPYTEHLAVAGFGRVMALYRLASHPALVLPCFVHSTRVILAF